MPIILIFDTQKYGTIYIYIYVCEAFLLVNNINIILTHTRLVAIIIIKKLFSLILARSPYRIKKYIAISATRERNWYICKKKKKNFVRNWLLFARETKQTTLATVDNIFHSLNMTRAGVVRIGTTAHQGGAFQVPRGISKRFYIFQISEKLQTFVTSDVIKTRCLLRFRALFLISYVYTILSIKLHTRLYLLFLRYNFILYY